MSTRIGDRYVVEEVLGRGGMAVVYRVRDEQSDEQLALKQLEYSHGSGAERLRHLFDQEFHTLVQLTHPRIIRVCEYGVDGAPFYTMELLEGTDLRHGVPFHWKTACGLLRDVASALAVVHSRRLVHRDVTPQNVRVVDHGRAKLIDFGAMVPMGVPSQVVGTPPFVAPEALNAQPLDGRADLYSLGALAYKMLTGKHAYPARRLEHLHDLFRTNPIHLGELVEDLPASLSALVMSLLSLDVLARPAAAAEVIEKLEAIAELARDREEEAARAYLVTPTLVGRDKPLSQVRARLLRAVRGKGSAVRIHGGRGTGRTRFLTSLVLEAKLAGMQVFIARGVQSDDGDFDTLRELLKQRPHAKDEAMPREVELLLRPTEELDQAERAWLAAEGRRGLVDFLRELAERHPLFVAVDDLDRADRLSVSILAELAHLAPRTAAVLAFTLCDDEEQGPARWSDLVSGPASPVRLRALGAAEEEALLRSMFGDAPSLAPFAHFVHTLSAGNPGTCVGLAQHLFDQGVVRYESGRWVLPSDPSRLGLSSKLEKLFSSRLSGLPSAARALSEVLAMIDPSAPIEPEHYPRLLDRGIDAPAALNDLLASDVVRPHGPAYEFSHPVLAQTLRDELSPERAREIHLRLAELYAGPPFEDGFIAACHLQDAGECQRAAEILAAWAQQRNEALPRGTLQIRYRLARRAYRRALDHLEAHDPRPRALFELRRAALGLGMYYDPRVEAYVEPVLSQLSHDSGRLYWDEFSGVADPTERIAKCLARAQERYDATSEQQRCLPPERAVRALALTASLLSGVYGRTLDVEAAAKLPSIVEPFRGVFPLIDIFYETLLITNHAMAGLDALPKAEALLDRILGSEELSDNLMIMGTRTSIRYYSGVWMARQGVPGSLAVADQMEREMELWRHRNPTNVPLGRYRIWHVRLLSHLADGNYREARRCREQIERLQLDGVDLLVSHHARAGTYLAARLNALAGSLLEIKSAMDTIEEQARYGRSWEPVLVWLRGEYHRARGAHSAASEALQQALDMTGPGRHFVWTWALPSLVEVLIALRKTDEALRLARRGVEVCQGLEVPLGVRVEHERALALAEAHDDHPQSAAHRLDQILSGPACSLRGIWLGRLHEARARVAALAGDAEAFRRSVALAGEMLCRGEHPVLVARHQALEHEGYRSGLLERPVVGGEVVSAQEQERTDALALVRTALGQCESADERARRALSLLIQRVGALGGHLLVPEEVGLRLVATTLEPPTDDLLEEVEALVERAQDDATVVLSQLTEGGAKRLARVDSTFLLPVLLPANSVDETVAAVALLRIEEGQLVDLPWALVETLGRFLVPGEEEAVLSILALD